MADQSQVKRLLRSVEEWNRWREGKRNEKIDLARADLIGADLSRADLSAANLIGANLSGANLSETNLSEANLFQAWLRRADLARANLSDANLSEADLTWAELRGTELGGADISAARLFAATLVKAVLRATDVANAQFTETIVGDVDLRGALNLETVVHHGPSVIGIDTLYRSEGHIPEVFLRGAGVSENLIELQRSITVRGAIEFYSCFIGYSHKDKAFCRRLHDALQGRGIRCWLDEKKLVPGVRLLDAVEDAIRLHDKLVVCCSKTALNSWWVKDEIRKALEKEIREEREIIVPLNLDGYLFDGWQDGLAADVRSRLAADFTGWEKDNDKFEEQVERVVKALRLER